MKNLFIFLSPSRTELRNKRESKIESVSGRKVERRGEIDGGAFGVISRGSIVPANQKRSHNIMGPVMRYNVGQKPSRQRREIGAVPKVGLASMLRRSEMDLGRKPASGNGDEKATITNTAPEMSLRIPRFPPQLNPEKLKTRSSSWK